MKKLNVNTAGNRKLQNTAEVRWLIWNLPAVRTCPFSTAMCRKYCYALKAERCYPGCLPSRERNLEETKDPAFVENMVYTIRDIIRHKVYTGKKVIFRIHESGDFYSQQYAKDWIEICKAVPEVTFLAYTKSIPFFIGLDRPENFIIRASLWDDTLDDLREMSEDLFPIYTALPVSKYEELKANGTRVAFCKCTDCARCQMCVKSEIKWIDVAIH